MRLSDLYPSAKDFVKSINLALAGKNVTDSRIGEYTFCKNLKISKTEMDKMDEEDILSFGWVMRRESKNNNDG